MLEESQSHNPGVRLLRELEKALVEQLLQRAGQKVIRPPSLDCLEVQEMSDGGMGSLYFVAPTKSRAERRFGGRVAELQFADTDGVPVLASLNVDKDGDLFELDIWKTDFSPVIKIPGP